MEHPFKVGDIYANRLGEYIVIELHEDAGWMAIRYLDTGETVRASIELLARVYQNILWEQEAAEHEVVREEARFLRGYGDDFSGLTIGDFKTSVEGTFWRSRAGLAGLVARTLSANVPYTFISWAIYRWPAAFLTHREGYEMAAFEMGSRKAKFTIELDGTHAYYGFYVERNDGPMDAVWDWPRFISALHADRNLQDVIAQAELEHGARFVGRRSRGKEHFHYANGLTKGAVSLWHEGNAGRHSVSERLELLDGIPADCWGEVYIVAHLAKQEAIEAGRKVATKMAALMRTLLPVYAAAVGHRE